MKKVLLAILFFCLLRINSYAAIKEVEFNWNSPSVLWENQTGYVPCKEPFYIKVSNCPAGTTDVVINIYESSGTNRSSITRGTLKGTFSAVSKSASEFSALIGTSLSFRRFYFIDVILTTTITTTTKTTGSSTAPSTTTNTTSSSPNPDITITTTTSSTSVTSNISVSTPGNPVTEVTTETKTLTQTRKTPMDAVYALPLKSEISSLQFLGSLGAASFTQKNLKSIDNNVGFITGLKFKLRPVSTNSAIGRFGLYPRFSRWSLFFGTVINDLNYKSTEITSLVFGLKPALGLDYEFGNGAIGVSAGVVVGNQDTKSKLSSNKDIATGVFLGLSFSSDVFQSFRKNIPASQNFPSTQNQ